MANQSFSPAQALWNQRHSLAKHQDSLRSLMDVVQKTANKPFYDLTPPQWVQFFATVCEYKPNVVIELGRDFGNSTACFLEAAQTLPDCRVVSWCLTDLWHQQTLPALQQHRRPEWFARGNVQQTNILHVDLKAELKSAERVLVLWDAHGFTLAEWVLGEMMPLLKDRSHLVMMHDMTDLRYQSPPPDYQGRLWHARNGGDGSDESYIWLGHICSRVGQVIPAVDFTTRNGIPLHSADESLYRELAGDGEKTAELKQLLGEDLAEMCAHWFYFSLEEATTNPLVFPRYEAPPTACGLAPPPIERPTILRRVWNKVRRRLAG